MQLARRDGTVNLCAMDCPTVRTLTLNPSIDASSDTAKVEPVVKLRMTNEKLDAGGGGINVARVLKRLGVEVEAVYLAGGANGHVLDHLLERMGLPHESVKIAGDSRMSMTVHETGTGNEYRFVPEGPEVSAAEVEAVIAAATDCASPWFVASGSIPRGVGKDIYAGLGERLGPNVRLVLDTSGAALASALEAGGLYLVKASGDEFASATGKQYDGHRAAAAGARALVDSGKAELVAVSFGSGGAVLAAGTARGSCPRPRSRRSAPSAPATASSPGWSMRWPKGWTRARRCAGAAPPAGRRRCRSGAACARPKR